MPDAYSRTWNDYTDDLDEEAMNDLEDRMEARGTAILGSLGPLADLVPVTNRYPYFISSVLAGQLPVATDTSSTAIFGGGPGNGIWGYNPSYDRNPTNSRKWLCLDAVIRVARTAPGVSGTNNRAYFRSCNLSNVDDPAELNLHLVQSPGGESVNGYGPNDDGSDLTGVLEGSTIGFVVWRGAIATASGVDPSHQVDSARIGVSATEDVRSDTVTRFTSSSVSLPQDTIQVTSSMDNVTAADGQVKPFEENGLVKVGGQKVAYASRTATKLLGCTGGTGTIAAGSAVSQTQNHAGGTMELKTSTNGTTDSAERIKLDGDGGLRLGLPAISSKQPTWLNIQGGQTRCETLTDLSNLTYTIVGTPGSKTITYYVVGNAPYGQGTSNPESITITDAPTTLSDTNYIRLEWDANVGYESFDVIRESTDGTPSGTGPVILHQRYYEGQPSGTNPGSQYGASAVDNGLSVGGLNEVQTVRLVRADGGIMTWTFDGHTTDSVGWDVSAATIQTKLRALTSVGGANVDVLKLADNKWQVTFTNALGDTNVPQITVDASRLTNSVDPDEFPHRGAPPEADVTTVVQGLDSSYTKPTRNSTGDFQFEGGVTIDQTLQIGTVPTITGSRASGAALANLLTALEDRGLIIDGSSA
jgi:hypothetical protein